MTTDDRIFARASTSVPSEVDDVALRVAEGALPPDLRGVLYRNGPGTNASFGVPYAHPFDGDGHVLRFAFDGKAVRYRNRFVDTNERRREARAKKPLYRSFGTNLPGGLRKNLLRMSFKNAANTSVVWHGEKLLALWEGGLPHRLEPRTLSTLARYDYDGRLRNTGSRLDRLLAPELPFAAHPKVDPATGELVNFGVMLGMKPRILIHRVSRDGALAEPESIAVDRLVFLHDFVLTARCAILFLVPVAFRVAPAVLGLLSPADAIESVAGAPTRILMVPRSRASQRAAANVMLEASPCFVFHFVGAYEREDEKVDVIGLRMPRFPSTEQTRALLAGRASDFPPALPTRWVLDVHARRTTEECLTDVPAELPTSDPSLVTKRVGVFFSLAGAPDRSDPFLKRVQRFEIETGRAVARDFAPDLPGEPLFVPRTNHVLVLVYRAAEHRSDLYVLDADDLKTVCRLELPHHVPPGFHGTWVESDSAA